MKLQLRDWLLVTALLVPLARGQHDRGFEHDLREQERGHEGHEHGHEGRDHEDHFGPRGMHGAPLDTLEGEDGGQGMFQRPPACTTEQTQAGLEASNAYITCTGLEFSDLGSLVHADMEIVQAAAACFKQKIEEIEGDVTPGEQTEEEAKEMEAKLDKALDDCVEQGEKGDPEAAEATADFFQKLLGPDSKLCSCFPAYVDKMPECEAWSRFHHFGMRLEEVCQHVSSTTVPGGPGPVAVPTTQTEEGEGEGEGEPEIPEEEVVEIKDVKPETEPAGGAGPDEAHPPHLPNTWGPCPKGQELPPGTNDPKGCQPSMASEEGFGGPEGRDDRGGPPEGGGGLFGLGMSVLGVVAVGTVVGVGGVWVWQKFQSGTRQPGVRYMAAGLEDDNLGTELGPFGREYA